MNRLSTRTYKGTRDYYPEDKLIQNYIFSNWRKVAQKYGYQDYGAPVLEMLEIYTAKSGQELANEQTYTFTDRGERSVAIRPEMTPSVSRMVAARRQELGYPARLFSIANFMRYERPQHGREREFWQLNTDIFGVDNIYAESEMITMAYDLVKIFNAKDNMFNIRINHRGLINTVMRDYLGLDEVGAQLMIKLFDRRNKISSEEFSRQTVDIFGEGAIDDSVDKLNKLIMSKTLSDLPKSVQDDPAVGELNELFSILDKNGVKNVEFDITLMRGLDYYTGVVFEAFDTHPENNRSMFGGGRYDGLVGLFGVEPISTVGMAPGATTFYSFLESHNLLPKLDSSTDVCVIYLDDDYVTEANSVANSLREEGVNVEVDLTSRKTDKKIKAAEKRGVPFVLFIGEREYNEHIFNLKDLKTRQEEKMSLERIISKISDYRVSGRPDDDIYI